MERSHQPGDIIAQRYQIITILGQGGTGTTYAAQDQRNNQRVAIKEMSLRRIKDWKDLDLFEREAQVLSYLDIITYYRKQMKLITSTDKYYTIPVRKCRLFTRISNQPIEFAQFISQREREWVVEEVSTFLERLRQHYPHLKLEDNHERT